MLIKRLFNALIKRRWLLEFYYNYFCKRIIRDKYSRIVIYKHSTIIVDKQSTIKLTRSLLVIGLPCDYDCLGMTSLNLVNGGEWVLNSNFIMLSGSCISVLGGKLNTGLTNLSYGSVIRCYKNIFLGNHVRIARNCIITDSDSHRIFIDGVQKKMVGNVEIGNDVWICSNATILKCSIINDNVVIGSNTIVSCCEINADTMIRSTKSFESKQIDFWKR